MVNIIDSITLSFFSFCAFVQCL